MMCSPQLAETCRVSLHEEGFDAVGFRLALTGAFAGGAFFASIDSGSAGRGSKIFTSDASIWNVHA